MDFLLLISSLQVESSQAPRKFMFNMKLGENGCVHMPTLEIRPKGKSSYGKPVSCMPTMYQSTQLVYNTWKMKTQPHSFSSLYQQQQAQGLAWSCCSINIKINRTGVLKHPCLNTKNTKMLNKMVYKNTKKYKMLNKKPTTEPFRNLC